MNKKLMEKVPYNLGAIHMSGTPRPAPLPLGCNVLFELLCYNLESKLKF